MPLFHETIINSSDTADTGLSPAQLIFGRATKNFFSIKQGNLQRRIEWKSNLTTIALARRHVRRGKISHKFCSAA